MSKFTFIVAEPIFLLRKGIVSLVNEFPNTIVVREMENVTRLSETISRYSPDAIIVDSSILSELTQDELKKISSRKKQIFIAGIIKNEHKPTDNGKLITHFFKIDDDKSEIQKQLKDIVSRIDTNRGSPSISSELSEREMEILKDVALGMSNKEIAEKNYISPHTVITHRKNITRKLGIKTVSGLTIYAIINKLIGMDEVK